MAVAIQQHHDRVAAYLKKKPGADVSLADVVALAEITAQSLQGVFETMDAAVHRELREIADYIAAMKAEIAGLHFNELKHTRIPAAGQELDAVVKATEAASNTIMECAEAVLAADAGDPAFKAMVESRAALRNRIYRETGMRIEVPAGDLPSARASVDGRPVGAAARRSPERARRTPRR